MSAPTLGLTKKPSLTQEREKLERDQVFCVIYWLFTLILWVWFLHWTLFKVLFFVLFHFPTPELLLSCFRIFALWLVKISDNLSDSLWPLWNENCYKHGRTFVLFVYTVKLFNCAARFLVTLKSFAMTACI